MTDEKTIRTILAGCTFLVKLFTSSYIILDKLHNCDVMIREDVRMGSLPIMYDCLLIAIPIDHDR